MDAQQLCTFFAGELFLAVDARKIREITRARALTPIPHAPHAIAGLLNLRSQIVPVLDLRRCLGQPERGADAPVMNVIIHGPEGLIALLVDGVGAVVERSQDTLEPPPHNLPDRARALIRGAYLLDEALLLDLNTEALADPATWRRPTPRHTPTPAAAR